MRTLSLLSILSVVVIHGYQDATINASGEESISDDDDDEAEAATSSLADTDTFQISTLTGRCIHIGAQLPPQPISDDSPKTCTDYENWFDGTNSCAAYAKNKHDNWCEKYGSWNYQTTKYTANQACCICGGGNKPSGPPRLQVGEYIKLAKGTNNGQFDNCQSMKVSEVNHQPQFHYMIEVMKECGPKKMVRDNRGFITHQNMFQPGMKIKVPNDDPNVINRHVRVELKKCRNGMKEQEFKLTPVNEHESDMILGIKHALTGIELSSAFDAKTPYVNVTEVFEQGLFEGSEDLFFLKIRMNNGALAYLGSGYFGEKEYSMVAAYTLAQKRGYDEQEYSWWQFKPVVKSDNESAVDDHAEWLIRKTKLIGIDYLVQLSPWHLLDVDREASKNDVKSRFRELSRSFHPDKLLHQSEKKALYEKIFVILQNAYQNLKSDDEREKEKFRVASETSSQLFAHSNYVVELLPFHWTKLDGIKNIDRYALNVSSHLNSTLLDTATQEEESEPTVQIWVTLMYSARCGMSRSVVGMIDLAARHLENHFNIKVGAYGCGLYSSEQKQNSQDPTGVTTDPICAQFQRRETPNVHVIVETIVGKKRDENGDIIDVLPDLAIVNENAQFKHFYSAVPQGNTTQFFPHHFIDFAKAGKKVWENNHLVHKMTEEDFLDSNFIGNVSIVAYLDGTGNMESNSEVVDTIISSLPGVARRFFNDDLYVGVARCGYGGVTHVEKISRVKCMLIAQNSMWNGYLI